MRIGGHAVSAFGSKSAQLGNRPAARVEQFFRVIAAQPGFQQLQVFRILTDLEDRDLVGAPEAFELVAVDFFRAGPAFGGSQHDHRPAGPAGVAPGELAVFASVALDGANVVDAVLEHGGHGLVHDVWVVAFDEVRIPAIAAEEPLQFLVRNAREDCGIGDLVAVQMQDGQNGAVAHGVEEFVAVPGGREGAGFCLAVADDAVDDQIGIVEGRAESVGETVAELATFVDRPGCFRRAVTANATGEGKFPEELAHSFEVLAFVRIDFGVGAFHPGMRQHRRSAMAGTADVNHVQVIFADKAVEMHPKERLTRIGAPVAQQALLDVLRFERLAQQGIVVEVDHSGAEIIAGAPVGVHLAEFFCVEDFRDGGHSGHEGPRFSV